jgi:DsbC/DsbD-like thiol-disulfide interchange protein
MSIGMQASRALMSVILWSLMVTAGQAQGTHSTNWTTGHNSKVRLLSNGYRGPSGGDFFAGVEIQLAPAWKTYWRMPGDAGVPPNFDWSASQNVAEATVLYPAPIRMADQGGEAIGYKTSVTFPVRVKPKDATQPVTLVLALEYGVCRDICIPTEAKLNLVLTPAPLTIFRDPVIAAALLQVPRGTADRQFGDPEIGEIAALLVSVQPGIKIKTKGVTDLFIEAPDGIFFPQPKSPPTTDASGIFIVDLTRAPDFKDLIGKPLRITAVGATGSIETTWILK